jgi:hypothetical protein
MTSSLQMEGHPYRTWHGPIVAVTTFAHPYTHMSIEQCLVGAWLLFTPQHPCGAILGDRIEFNMHAKTYRYTLYPGDTLVVCGFDDWTSQTRQIAEMRKAARLHRYGRTALAVAATRRLPPEILSMIFHEFC